MGTMFPKDMVMSAIECVSTFDSDDFGHRWLYELNTQSWMEGAELLEKLKSSGLCIESV